jgi:alpha-L-fucosidase
MRAFEPNRNSLETFEIPDWFRDAKFGIYCHWGPQCVPMCDGWYARNMYVEGHRAYKHHVKNYGHPSKFGYKDIIALWKAENFDPDTLVALFKEAGAKYFTPVAVHHDNFDLWDSKFTRWNAVKMGPRKDIIKMWSDAALKHGLIFGVTTHLERSYSWMQVSHHADATGPMKGVPYDGELPEYRDLYFEKQEDDNFRSPLNPPASWREHWKARIKDLIDNYHPNLLYFDGACPFMGDDQGKSGMEVIAHLYNDNLKQTGGKSNGVQFIKKIPNHGIFIDGICLIDYEGHAQGNLDPIPWQTDVSIGDWFYRRPDLYKSVTKLIHVLADIVSKNGNLLLNIPPLPDGTLDPRAVKILKGIGKWMRINGEAIHGTRPWKQAMEGSTRFTSKGDTIYMILLKRPIGKFTIRCLGKDNLGKEIQSIEDLETRRPMRHVQSQATLTVKTPGFTNFHHAKVYKIQVL